MTQSQDVIIARKKAEAWAKYRKLMIWMSSFTFISVIIAFAFLYAFHGFTSVHMYIATAAGMAFSVMLAAALMGLVFLSNASGHDDVVSYTTDQDDAADD